MTVKTFESRSTVEFINIFCIVQIPEMVQNCYKEDVQYVQEKFGKLHALAAVRNNVTF